MQFIHRGLKERAYMELRQWLLPPHNLIRPPPLPATTWSLSLDLILGLNSPSKHRKSLGQSELSSRELGEEGRRRPC